MLLRALFTTTCNDAMPSGALDGIIALIWPALTYTGMALPEVAPCTTLTETPPRVVPNGNELAVTDLVGPIWAPKIVNIEPCAMAPAGTPAGMKLAALYMERL